MKNNRNVLHKKWVKTPSIENRNFFTSCSNNVIKAIRESRRRYYDNMITRKKNLSGIFEALNISVVKKIVNIASVDDIVFIRHFATNGGKITKNFKKKRV